VAGRYGCCGQSASSCFACVERHEGAQHERNHGGAYGHRVVLFRNPHAGVGKSAPARGLGRRFFQLYERRSSIGGALRGGVIGFLFRQGGYRERRVLRRLRPLPGIALPLRRSTLRFSSPRRLQNFDPGRSVVHSSAHFRSGTALPTLGFFNASGLRLRRFVLVPLKGLHSIEQVFHAIFREGKRARRLCLGLLEALLEVAKQVLKDPQAPFQPSIHAWCMGLCRLVHRFGGQYSLVWINAWGGHLGFRGLCMYVHGGRHRFNECIGSGALAHQCGHRGEILGDDCQDQFIFVAKVPEHGGRIEASLNRHGRKRKVRNAVASREPTTCLNDHGPSDTAPGEAGFFHCAFSCRQHAGVSGPTFSRPIKAQEGLRSAFVGHSKRVGTPRIGRSFLVQQRPMKRSCSNAYARHDDA
jgi:hypothetical protein